MRAMPIVPVIDVVVGAETPLLRLGLRAACEPPALIVVGEFAADARGYLDDPRLNPAVVVVEAAVLGADASEVIARCSDRHRLLLVASDALDKPQMLRAGASGFVSRHVGASALRDAVRSAHAGDLVLEEPIHLAPPAAIEPHAPPLLTRREKDVLRLLADGHSTDEVAAELYMGATTVKAHLRNASAKLNARSRTGAVARAARLGLLDWRDPSDDPPEPALGSARR